MEERGPAAENAFDTDVWVICYIGSKEQHCMCFLWGIRNPKWPSLLMEKANISGFEERHHLHRSKPRLIACECVCMCTRACACVCVAEGHSLLQCCYNSFKYLLLECKFCWKLKSLLWKKQTITYHECCRSVEYPSPFWRNKRIWLYKQVTALNYRRGGGEELLTAGWTIPWLCVNWNSAELARSRAILKWIGYK